jgi:ParB family chromosome partitioning protein
MGHGRALLSLLPAQQIQVAHSIIQKRLSVREAERLVNQIERPAPKKMYKPDRDLLRLQEEVSERLGAQVLIKPKKNGQGNIMIHYTDLDQLDDILAKL